jgi:hypothetical protein
MKKVLIITGILIASFLLVTSKYVYDQKLRTTALEAKQLLIESTMNEEQEKERKRQRFLTRHIVEPVASLVNQAIETNSEVNIVIVSSEYLEAEEVRTWPQIFQAELEAKHLNNLLSVKAVMYTDKSSSEFLLEQQYNLIIEEKPDILLIEPFLLNDHGISMIENTLENLDVIVNEIRDVNRELVVIVQPPHPLYGEDYYLAQVAMLQAHSSERGYIYFDHWKTWPKNGYVDNKIPNQKGHQHWAEYTLNYFISDK